MEKFNDEKCLQYKIKFHITIYFILSLSENDDDACLVIDNDKNK